MKKDSLFWVGYSDLLTSLFFVMLVLFSITFFHFKLKNQQLEASVEQLEQIREVELALGSLDERYYSFDQINKRYRLNIDVNFPQNKSGFNLLPNNIKTELRDAGWEIYNMVFNLITVNPDIEYLMIVEGHAQKSRLEDGSLNSESIPEQGYKVSYQRALGLVNFWKEECKIPFGTIGDNCELLIVGSGHFGQSRDNINERNNRRFTIQITSKVGKFLNNKQK